MARKFNAFLAFVDDYKKKEFKNEKPYPNIKTLINIVTPMWNILSAEKKNEYKNLADELNSKKNAQQSTSESSTTVQLQEIVDRRSDTSDYYKMQSFITLIFKSISKNDLLDKNFILVHVNSYCHTGENYYFPAEIAALQFNLRNGIQHTYHQIVGISKIYPRGYAGQMRQHSDKFHQIYCWESHPDDYINILKELIKFIKNVKDDNKDSSEELPYIYTIETEIGFDMMQTKASLENLYKTAYPEMHENGVKNMFNIGSLDRLFNEMKNKMEIDIPESTQSARDILETDMYGSGLGCMYHEIRDIAFKCSKARILQWMSNICKFFYTYDDLPILPGRHLAIQLRNGSRMIIENNDTPLSKLDLKIEHFPKQ